MSFRRRRAALAGALTAALAFAGCGGDDSDGTTEGGPEPSETTTAVDGTEAAYLEAPEGVELTEPGTELGLGESAVAAWTPRQDLVGVVEVAVSAVERGTIARDFQGYSLDEASQTATPYFVRAEVTNDGDTDLGERRLPLYLVDDTGRLVEPSPVDEATNTFAPCPRAVLPAVFAPDDEAETCLVYLVPSGASFDVVMFRPPEGVVPITWAGEPTAYQPPKPPKPKKPRKPRNRGGGNSGS